MIDAAERNNGALIVALSRGIQSKLRDELYSKMHDKEGEQY